MPGRGHAWWGHAWQEARVGGNGSRGVHGRGTHGRGHAWKGGKHGEEGMCGRRDGHCSGRYASYWNAFLFLHLVYLKYS